jgi:6-phosphogluconolactonase
VAPPVTTPEVRVFADEAGASRAAADSFRSLAAEAASAGRRFSVALTGGSSPHGLFSLLASDEHRGGIDWSAVHLFWGDERCVPPAHPRSNFGAANRLLLSRIPIPAANVHRIRGELPPADGARLYAEELERFLGAEPRFDLVHLGMGDDGHVCSLFPYDPLLRESRRTTGTALHRAEAEWRVSLTFPVLDAARRVEFLVFGAGKAERVRQVLAGARDPLRIPAQRVRPTDGELVWWLDEAAAGQDAIRR